MHRRVVHLSVKSRNDEIRDNRYFSTTSLTRLPDDCLLQIIDEFKKISHAEWNMSKSLKALSAVNASIRALCVPRLFNLSNLKVKVGAKPEILQKHLDALVSVSFVQSNLR
jgi:hypothetical protein